MSRRSLRLGVSTAVVAGLMAGPLGAFVAAPLGPRTPFDPTGESAAQVVAPDPAPEAAPVDEPELLAQRAPGPARGPATVPGVPGGPTPQQSTALGLRPDPSPKYVRASIESVSPHVADGAPGTDAVNGVPLVVVTTSIRNVSGVPVHGVVARLQRAAADNQAATMRSALTASEDEFEVAGPFETVADTLAPGEERRFELRLPLAAVDGQHGLDVTTPGIYPLLVAVSGTPEGAGTIPLHSARTLLPVLPEALRHLPGRSESHDPEVRSAPRPVTMLYPIAAEPTRRATVPGLDGNAPVVHLTDDSLLREIGLGGRLDGMLKALETAESRDETLGTAVCLAVDPELLRTVDDIAAGQKVVVDGPERASEDTGAAPSARSFLDRLRALATGRCVVPLPPNQADLTAVAATDSTALGSAVSAGPALEVTRVLGVTPVPNVVVPPTGTMTSEAVAHLPALQQSRLVLAATSVRAADGSVPAPGVIGLDGGPTALTFDSSLGTALAATGTRPENARYATPEQRYWLDADSPEARLQDARAALLAPVLAADQPADPAANDAAHTADTPDAATPPPPADPVVIVPPQVWTLDDAGISSFLDVLSAQLRSGALHAVSLPDALAAAPGTPGVGSLETSSMGAAVTADTLGQDSPEFTHLGGASGFASGVAPATDPDTDPGAIDVATIGRIREAMRRLGTLRTVVDTDDPSAANASGFLDPLRSEALRALTTTGRRSGGDGSINSLEQQFGTADPAAGPTTGRAARTASAAAVDRLEQALDLSFSSIELLPPGTVYRMASPNSPLLLVARNGMPFPIRVGVRVDTPPGMRVDAQGQIAVPARGSRTIQLPAQSTSSDGRREGITMQLTTAEGAPLSDPVQVSVQSGGSRWALVFTVVAFVAAVGLVARRIVVVRRGRRTQEGTA